MKIKEIIRYIEMRYPLESMESYDNSGANIINFNDDIKNVMLCLDINFDAIDYAISNDVNLIISHHPIIFNPIKNLNDDVISKKIKLLIKNNINAYSMHTNFDSNLKHGMGNAVVFKLFKNIQIIKNEPLSKFKVNNKYYGIGNILKFKKSLQFDDFYNMIINNLKVSPEKIALYNVSGGKKISDVILLPGSGSGEMDEILRIKPELLITSDLKHNQIIDLIDMDISYINASHFGLENVFCEYVYNFLRKYIKSKIFIYNLINL